MLTTVYGDREPEYGQEELVAILNDYQWELNDSSSASQLAEDDLEIQQNRTFDQCWQNRGKWQLYCCIVLSLLQCATTLHMFVFVFQTVEKDFWCARPQHLHSIDIDIWRNLTNSQDSCSILDIDYNGTANANDFVDYMNLQPQLLRNYTKCQQFEFSDVDGGSKTLKQDFNLICDQQKLVSVVEMCFLAGAAVGSVSSGWISDRFGRKRTLMTFATIQTIFGTILAFSPTLSIYMTLRVVIGFASMTVAVVSFVLVVELVSGKWRTIIGILNILPVALAYILCSGLAYFIRDWRTLQLVVSTPWFIFLSMWYCVPESPRWLLARGKLTELYAVVERAAQWNRINLPANYQKSLEAVAPVVNKISPTNKITIVPSNGSNTIGGDRSTVTTNITGGSNLHSNPLVVVFSRLYWRTTCLTLILWLTLIIIYFGLTLHLSNLGGNIYINTAIAGSVEAVTICLSVFVVLKFGIKRNLIAYMFIPGLCCLATNLVPKGDEYNIYIIILAMIAKCIIGANNAIIPTYTAMQYPTVVRNFGVGMGNLAAGIALILVPYMWLLEHIDPLLPMSIMGVSGIVGAISLLLMKDIQQQ